MSDLEKSLMDMMSRPLKFMSIKSRDMRLLLNKFVNENNLKIMVKL